MTEADLRLQRNPLLAGDLTLISREHADLTAHNTFALPSRAERLWIASSLRDLHELRQSLPDMPRIMSGGSNLLLPREISGDVLMPLLRGVAFQEIGDSVRVLAGAGECWHDLVVWTAEQGWWGIENLALIPGCVGAAPIQNIGAYGVELSSSVRVVHWLDWSSGQVFAMSREACQFAYRESRFKGELRGRGLVVALELELSKRPSPRLEYGPLVSWASGRTKEALTAGEVVAEICRIRRSKLPNPQDIPNAGSFFKNPVVDESQHAKLKDAHPELVAYPVSGGRWKIAAAWLIDRLGLKGFRMGAAGVHEKQALVLVNHGGASWSDMVQLADHVRSRVRDAFGVLLEPEVQNWGPWPWR